MSDPNFYIIVVVLVITLLTLAAGLAAFLIRDLNRRNAAPPHASTDLTNMTILFHTMRDVVAQQKQLAADFNRSLDRRVNEIKKVVELIRKERELLRQSRAQLNDLVQRANALEAALKAQPSSGPSADPATPAPSSSARAPVVEAPAETEDIVVPEDDLIEHWTGLDFSDVEEEDEDDEYSEPVPEPIAPEDAEAARDAFRTLLNLNAADEQPPAEAAPADQAHAGNGRDRMNNIERLVYEYSDAGMRVPDIARELGIGKGEVRLIQSLRKKKGH